MLCYIFLIFAIVGCDGRDVPTTVEVFDIDELESFNVTAVPIPPTTPQTVTRIIGGTQTTIENYPYAVQILYYNQPMCGGSLLTRLHVLSAAHCFVSENGVLESARFFRVRVGTTYLNSGGSVYSVSSIINHERYNHTTHDNDISVLLLSSRVTLGSSVKTALIPQQGDTLADNSTVVVIGWGSTHAIITTMSSVLNEVSVRTVNRGICTDRYNYLSSILRQPHPITDTMMCAGLLDIGGADACQGDSGGPLIYDGLVVGITSWGYGCARPRYPGVYAQVSVFTSWINQTVRMQVIRSQRNSSPNSHAGIVALLIPIIFIMLSM